MVLDTMDMLVWDTMDMLVLDTMGMLVLDILAMVMVLAMVITMERGKLNLLLTLKLTLLCFIAPTDMVSGITAMLGLVIMDMVLAMDTMASVQPRWCNTFSCHCSDSKEIHTAIENHEIVIKKQILFPK